MRYAQFYQMSVAMPGNPSRPMEALGDRAVIILDGRNRIDFSNSIARKECVKRGYIGFSIHEGESFTSSRMVTKYKSV